MSVLVVIAFIVVIVVIVIFGMFVKNFVQFNNNIIEDDKDEDTEEIKVDDGFDISYKDEEYVTRNKDGYVISTSKRNLPVIINDSNQNVADKIVDSLTEISNNEWNNNIKKMADELVEMYENISEDMSLGASYLLSTGVVTENRLSFIIKMDGSFGGVSWNGENGYNYDAKTGELLTFESIAMDYEDLNNTIYNEVKSYIERQEYVDDLWDDNANGTWTEILKELVSKSGNWYFLDNGIRIVIPKYSLGPGYIGIISVDVNKDIINDYLKDEYKIDSYG